MIKCRITDRGKLYTNYDTWTGLKGYEERFAYHEIPEEQNYNIIRIAKHGTLERLLALIEGEKDKSIHIIGITGIELVESECKESIKLNEKVFNTMKRIAEIILIKKEK